MSDQPSTVLGARFSRALEWAVDLQGTTGRKGSGVPYLAHTLGVVAIVLAYGGSETQAVAAVLHDVAEDSGGEAALERIRMDFDADVANLVGGLSDSLTTSKDQKLPWWPRKWAYVDNVDDKCSEVAFVSAADKLDNIRSIRADYRHQGAELWKIFNRDSGRAGQLWYYGTLVDKLALKLKTERRSKDQTDAEFRLQIDLAQDLITEFEMLLREVAEAERSTTDELKAEARATGERNRPQST